MGRGVRVSSHGDGLQRARGQHGRLRETVQVCHEQRVSGGSRQGEQTARGWYLFETRSDVGSTGARSRLRKRAGQANLKILGRASSGGCRVGPAKACRYAGGTTTAVWQWQWQSSREEACLSLLRPFGQGREAEAEGGKTRPARHERERACARSEALRYARATIGIIARIGGHWPATVIRLCSLIRRPRHSEVPQPLPSSSLVADAAKEPKACPIQPCRPRHVAYDARHAVISSA